MAVKRYDGSNWQTVAGLGAQGPTGANGTNGTDGTAPLTTKGDLLTFGTSVVSLNVGANNTVLTADSAEATGLKWAAPTNSGYSFSLLNSGGTSLSGSATVTISGIGGYDTYFVLVANCSSVNASSQFGITLNGDTSGYGFFGQNNTAGGTYNGGDFTHSGSTGQSAFRIVQMSGSATSDASFGVSVFGGNTTGIKMLIGSGGASAGGSNSQIFRTALGFSDANGAAITSISVVSSNGNFDAGTVYIYGGI